MIDSGPIGARRPVNEDAPVRRTPNSWDYLIVTASSEAQAAAYESQLRLRVELGLLADVDCVLAVADPGGRRIGSGGSTLWCLMAVLRDRLGTHWGEAGGDEWKAALGGLRILIVHAGGDSRRLPAYGPCGKIFVPVPGENDCALPVTLFDRQLPVYLGLPGPRGDTGQVVIASGDVLLLFEPAEVRFAGVGVTALGCRESPMRAKNHGVLCGGEGGRVRLFLQKPSPADQRAAGAVDPYGQVILDIGVMNFGAATAASLLAVFGARASRDGAGCLTGELGEALWRHGLDFYREICCGLGAEATPEHHARWARQSGSTWADDLLGKLFAAIHTIPFHVDVLPRCSFLDFGVSEHLIPSGLALLQRDRGMMQPRTCLEINNNFGQAGRLHGEGAWVEGCRIDSVLSLGGDNLVSGVDVTEPLYLPRGACLDVIAVRDAQGQTTWVVRCYGMNDRFKDPIGGGATFCNLPMGQWLEAAGVGPEAVWDADVPESDRTVWQARVFPRISSSAQYRQWLWMFDPAGATPQERDAWRAADRFSPAQVALAADQDAHQRRRRQIRAGRIRASLREMWPPGSGFSAAELACLLAEAQDRCGWVADVLAEARVHHQTCQEAGAGTAALAFPRVIHTLGAALVSLEQCRDRRWDEVLPQVAERLSSGDRDWLASVGLAIEGPGLVGEWARRACELAFATFGRTILASEARVAEQPRNSLRSDEIVWGRAPARLDIGGGWTDTPPYSLEHGGCVVNAAVNLNGQPPIQAYARVINEPVIRIGSIDLGAKVEITELGQLLDYRDAGGEFALAKAALALCGLSPQAYDWGSPAGLREILRAFGGGIELTTLAAVPKGSGLGTSSIMGAVLLAVISRVMGRTLSQRELFHGVLRLEQALTTGGGWQDQIGGAVGGAKIINTQPGLVPEARIHYLPADVLDPRTNGGQTLLYYTGITRLAKNILQQVVGRYLNRDRWAMATLRQIHALAPRVAETMSGKDLPEFGRGVDVAWELNKRLDPNSTNDEVEGLLERARPHVHGAKLLGAGGGGFLLMVCKAPADAGAVRAMLESHPPNDRARFFDFDVNTQGLIVTAC